MTQSKTSDEKLHWHVMFPKELPQYTQVTSQACIIDNLNGFEVIFRSLKREEKFQDMIIKCPPRTRIRLPHGQYEHASLNQLGYSLCVGIGVEFEAPLPPEIWTDRIKAMKGIPIGEN